MQIWIEKRNNYTFNFNETWRVTYTKKEEKSTEYYSTCWESARIKSVLGECSILVPKKQKMERRHQGGEEAVSIEVGKVKKQKQIKREWEILLLLLFTITSTKLQNLNRLIGPRTVAIHHYRFKAISSSWLGPQGVRV